MRHWTDQQFKDAGWLWLLRHPDSGYALACSVDAREPGVWMNEGRGDVIALSHLKEA